MSRRPFPRFPDFSRRRTVDDHLDRLDTHGVSRREFLALMSAAAAVGAVGLPGTAIASSSGKLAYLTFNLNEYNTIASAAFDDAARAFSLPYVALDGRSDGQRQVNQFEQQIVAGSAGAVFNLADGSAIRRIAADAQQNNVFFGNFWNTLPWYTPFDASEHYTLYAVPEEFAAHRAVTSELLKAVTEHFGGGDIVAVTGTDGYVTDIARSRGRDAAFADFPKTRLVDHLPGNWNREDGLKATDALLSRNPNVVGIVAQNDDIAQGVLAALRARGLRPGHDVLVVGADGTAEAVRAIIKGEQLATSGNSPAYAAGLFTARIYDVTHGWKPRAAERALNWRSLTITKANADVYRKRFVDNGKVAPFDYRRLSRVAHPTDWDLQAEVYPLDFEKEWTGIARPAGYTLPEAYRQARANGEFETVAAEYKAHYTIPFGGPSPVHA
ncbi:sugar ABC transporter substrate-binding protein [Pararobbsia silviterrae]|uniref:Sugar ABC transporter substrate-binding protein n=1 Tax=Pararobbsia silviterrae TaxID=1792498 RepID=A0A494Y3H0_9BURK|nr:sugar ABC transporter substrate-binding protein [Pararobbsia silviterrae]RKP56558.1 sugar ABC transporter substrate-binding protein [Pararobbsia silviterrae]